MAVHNLSIRDWLPGRSGQPHDRAAVVLQGVAQCIPCADGKRRVDVALTLERGQPAVDPGGLWEGLLDALAHAGLVVDASPRWSKAGTVEVGRGKKRRTTITLTDL
jgi:hypothetical protein